MLDCSLNQLTQGHAWLEGYAWHFCINNNNNNIKYTNTENLNTSNSIPLLCDLEETILDESLAVPIFPMKDRPCDHF